jgi:hypothetical protein
MLQGAKSPEAVASVTSEGKHGVDQVLQGLGTSQGTILGHMAHENDGNLEIARELTKLGGNRPHL